ncbi:hypothetical protein HanIR_Chr01g0018991 [Helianthus annuus]|nr:hypothetical protein HanIR_Chr01g0018991 [Helianthus annuus]
MQKNELICKKKKKNTPVPVTTNTQKTELICKNTLTSLGISIWYRIPVPKFFYRIFSIPVKYQFLPSNTYIVPY